MHTWRYEHKRHLKCFTLTHGETMSNFVIQTCVLNALSCLASFLIYIKQRKKRKIKKSYGQWSNRKIYTETLTVYNVYTLWYIHTRNAVHIYHIHIHIHVYLHITQWHFNNLMIPVADERWWLADPQDCTTY